VWQLAILGSLDGQPRLIRKVIQDIWRDLPDQQPGFQDRVSARIGSNGMPAPHRAR
jgi:hypothetical protein